MKGLDGLVRRFGLVRRALIPLAHRQNFRLSITLFYLSNISIETISFHEFYEFIIYI